MTKGWQTKTLGEVCAFDKAQGIHRALPYVGLEHIESHTARFIGSAEPQAVKSSTFRFSDAHVLYGRLRPYLNKALAPDFDGHCSTEIFPLKPSSELSREYLLYWLLADGTCERINATCTGARMLYSGELFRGGIRGMKCGATGQMIVLGRGDRGVVWCEDRVELEGDLFPELVTGDGEV